jgi:hypothetical protein
MVRHKGRHCPINSEDLAIDRAFVPDGCLVSSATILICSVTPDLSRN